MKKIRQSNYELLRIISMFLIVLCHVIHHGHIIENCINPTVKLIFEIILLMTMIHVNSFILLTGYFQCKSKFKQQKIWQILTESFFYRVFIVIVLSALGVMTFTKLDLFISFSYPHFNYFNWFINKYILLYCLSPFINKFINTLNKKDFQKLLLVLLLLGSILPYFVGNLISNNGGFTLYNFIILYFIGAYLRNYPLEESYLFKNCSKNMFQLITLSLSVLGLVLNFVFTKTSLMLIGTNKILDLFSYGIYNMKHAYSNPFIIMQAVFFFVFMGTLDIKSKIINHISKLTLAVYLIHDNEYIRQIIYKLFKIDRPDIYSYKFIPYAILVAIIIFIICIIIEELRQLLNKFISSRKLYKKIKNKYYDYVNNINIKDSV